MSEKVAKRERQLDKKKRIQQLKKLQVVYADFRDLYAACSMELLGFIPTDMQFDIADYLQTGPRYKMVQAQRGKQFASL